MIIVLWSPIGLENSFIFQLFETFFNLLSSTWWWSWSCCCHPTFVCFSSQTLELVFWWSAASSRGEECIVDSSLYLRHWSRCLPPNNKIFPQRWQNNSPRSSKIPGVKYLRNKKKTISEQAQETATSHIFFPLQDSFNILMNWLFKARDARLQTYMKLKEDWNGREEEPT